MVTGYCRVLLTFCLTVPSTPLPVQVEKRLELVKQVSHSTHKKLTACLQGQQGAEADKRSVSAHCEPRQLKICVLAPSIPPPGQSLAKATHVSASQPSKPWCLFLLWWRFCSLLLLEASPSPTMGKPASWDRQPRMSGPCLSASGPTSEGVLPSMDTFHWFNSIIDYIYLSSIVGPQKIVYREFWGFQGPRKILGRCFHYNEVTENAC